MIMKLKKQRPGTKGTVEPVKKNVVIEAKEFCVFANYSGQKLWPSSVLEKLLLAECGWQGLNPEV
jgi:hypothetical protein